MLALASLLALIGAACTDATDTSTGDSAPVDSVPSDDVTVRLSYDRTEDDAEPKGLTRLEPNLFCPLFLGVPCPPNENIFDTQSGLEPTNSTTSDGVALNLFWDINAIRAVQGLAICVGLIYALLNL